MTAGRLLKIVNGIMLVLFVSWAAFQYNDPDALAWILVYGVGALCAALFHFDRLSATFGTLVVAICLVWSLVLYFFVITTDEPYTFVDDHVGEILREALGLTIVAAWTAVLSWKSRQRRRVHDH